MGSALKFTIDGDASGLDRALNRAATKALTSGKLMQVALTGEGGNSTIARASAMRHAQAVADYQERLERKAAGHAAYKLGLEKQVTIETEAQAKNALTRARIYGGAASAMFVSVGRDSLASLASGANPLTVIAQQGPQVAQALTMIGKEGFKSMVGATRSGFARMLEAVAIKIPGQAAGNMAGTALGTAAGNVAGSAAGAASPSLLARFSLGARAVPVIGTILASAAAVATAIYQGSKLIGDRNRKSASDLEVVNSLSDRRINVRKNIQTLLEADKITQAQADFARKQLAQSYSGGFSENAAHVLRAERAIRQRTQKEIETEQEGMNEYAKLRIEGIKDERKRKLEEEKLRRDIELQGAENLSKMSGVPLADVKAAIEAKYQNSIKEAPKTGSNSAAMTSSLEQVGGSLGTNIMMVDLTKAQLTETKAMHNTLKKLSAGQGGVIY